jgi:plastocyanin
MTRTKTFQLATFLLLGTTAALGCSKSDSGSKPPAPTPSTTAVPGPTPTPEAPKPAAGGVGSITGTVSFDGTPPTMPELPRQTDPVCAAEKMNAPYVLVGATKGVKDTVVRLPVGAAPKATPPAEPLAIDQKSCMYSPRVAGVVAGQSLAIKNSDKTTHNIHTYAGDETVFNEAQQPGAADLKKEVEADPGAVLKLKCDVHRWMEAHIVVTDHNLFMVTGEDGSFKLENVPAGTYKLEAWHPYLGLKTADVTVEAGKPAEAKFTYAVADYKAPQ